MSKPYFCHDCNSYKDEGETEIILKKQTLCVNDLNITLSAMVRVCKDCNDDLIDEKFDTETLEMFYTEYENITRKEVNNNE